MSGPPSIPCRRHGIECGPTFAPSFSRLQRLVEALHAL